MAIPTLSLSVKVVDALADLETTKPLIKRILKGKGLSRTDLQMVVHWAIIAADRQHLQDIKDIGLASKKVVKRNSALADKSRGAHALSLEERLRQTRAAKEAIKKEKQGLMDIISAGNHG